MAHAGEDFALVVYGTDGDPRPRAPPPAPPPAHPRDAPAGQDDEEDVADRRIVPPASRKAYMEVLRTNWFHLKSDEYLRADSVQCPNCLRRFCPDRINSHERVCFKKQHAVGGEPQSQADSLGSVGGGRGGRSSPLVECYLCGKKFGTRSIGIHEPQCLKKWQQLHGEAQALDKPRDCPQLEGPSECKPLAIEFPSAAPAPGPAPTPGRPTRDRPRAPAAPAPEQPKLKSAWVGEDGAVLAEATAPKPAKTPAPPPPAAPGAAAPGAAAGRKPAPGAKQGRGRPLRCYLCGQMFGLQSLSIHEPQCLAKWRLENAKLPAELQRPEPQKPEIIFTEADGAPERPAG